MVVMAHARGPSWLFKAKDLMFVRSIDTCHERSGRAFTKLRDGIRGRLQRHQLRHAGPGLPEHCWPDRGAPPVALGRGLDPLYARSMAGCEIIVDARGHRCPVPTLRLRRALDGAPPGTKVRLLADDPMAQIDVPHFAGQIGATVLETAHDGLILSFLIRRE